MRSGGRRKSIAFFIVLGVCLVGGAVALNVGWIILNWREAGLLIARHHRLSPHHHRRRAQHDLPGARDPAQRAARRVHQRRHPRAEDAGRVDEAVPRRRCRTAPVDEAQAAGVLRRDAARTATGCWAPSSRCCGPAQLGAQAAPREPDAGRPRRRRARSASTLARTRHHLPPDALTYRSATSTARRSRCSATRTSSKAVVSNLVDNAIKYSGAKVHVAVELEQADARDGDAARPRPAASASRRPS